MNWKIHNLAGEHQGEVTLDARVFGASMNEPVLYQVIKAYRANLRQGTHATKTRTQVSGGGKKPFRQKGTGNARQGSSRSILMPGGGTAHGPQPRDYRQKINRKVKAQATRVALSDKVSHEALFVVSSFDLAENKASAVLSAMDKLGLKGKKVLFSDGSINMPLYRAARNIQGVNVVPSDQLNAFDLLNSDAVVMSESAVQAAGSRLAVVSKKTRSEDRG